MAEVGGNAAEVYERLLVPVMLAPWAPKLIDLAEVRPGMRAGCGLRYRRGDPPRRRAGGGPAGRVVGLDINAAMLSVARRLPPVGGASIEWLEASALEMPPPTRRSTWCSASMVSSNSRIAQPHYARCAVS